MPSVDDSTPPPLKPTNRALIVLLVAGAALLAFLVVRLITAVQSTDTSAPSRTDSVPVRP